ncbi:MAG: FtsX-like permease family protein [candidate division WOR-3 bacterium]
MNALQLAVRNLRGAGMRTWLNAIALSFAFVAIIFGQGMLQGMNKQAEDASTTFEVAGGQLWHQDYDPYDPLTLEQAHEKLPPEIAGLVAAGRAVPILIVQGSIYPQGRILPVLIKGILPEQKVLALPTQTLADTNEELPVLVGARMAKSAGLSVGDYVTVQWRDAEGALDARDGRVVEVFETSVGTVDIGQVWVPIGRLQELTGLQDKATLVTVARDARTPRPVSGWTFRPPSYLLSDLRRMVQSKTIGQSIMFGVLFLLAMLAIFDTQVLSIFRRRREIGMLIALGMTRSQVIVMFTLEGAVYGVLAAVLGAIYGAPLFIYLSANGFAIPGGSNWGFALGEKLYPAYTAGLILGTTLLVLVAATVVSWLPTRRIAKLKPTDALSGRGL